jgi:hypothetical protein
MGVDLQHELSGAACAAIAWAFEETPSLLRAWHRFNAQLVMRRGPTGEARFWSAESAEEASNETTVIEARLHRGFFDVQQDLSEQATALRHFNTDLPSKLQQGISDSLGPTLQRMVTTVEDLTEVLRAAGVQRQDALTGSLVERLAEAHRQQD